MAIVTLSTDIGNYDFIIGSLKGQLLSLHPALQIVDISHDLSSSNLAESAYICRNAFRYYPENTIHIVLVNLFEFKPTHLLVTKYGNGFLLCPDNGILTMICRQKPNEVIKVSLLQNEPVTSLRFLAEFAAAATKLALGKYPLQLGEQFTEFCERYPMRPSFGGNWIEGQIIFIDKFENVVVNISKEEFEEYSQGRKFDITFGRSQIISHIHENYGVAPNEECIACFNSAGMLELSVKNGNIASLFGLQGYKDEINTIHRNISNANAKNWFYQSVKIYFREEEKPV
ncbi:MAG: SAM-dependent chlorinase/fluorinase [Arachidicoccus sp.]|nr:SAM-dependent chlorinase/fluorinase [Arachidicoccus sp.]